MCTFHYLNRVGHNFDHFVCKKMCWGQAEMLMLPSLGTGDKLCIFKLDIHLSSGPQAVENQMV